MKPVKFITMETVCRDALPRTQRSPPSKVKNLIIQEPLALDIQGGMEDVHADANARIFRQQNAIFARGMRRVVEYQLSLMLEFPVC